MAVIKRSLESFLKTEVNAQAFNIHVMAGNLQAFTYRHFNNGRIKPQDDEQQAEYKATLKKIIADSTAIITQAAEALNFLEKYSAMSEAEFESDPNSTYEYTPKATTCPETEKEIRAAAMHRTEHFNDLGLSKSEAYRNRSA